MGGEAAAKTTEEEIEGAEGADEQAGKAEGEGEGAATGAGDKSEGEHGGDGQTEGEDEGLDVVEGEGATPAQGKKVVPLSTHLKVKDKWKAKARNAVKTAETLASENELLALENQQLKQRLETGTEKPRPKRDDFATDADFDKADRKWLDEQITRGVTETLRKAAPAAPARGTEEDDTDSDVDAHYERAAKLKAPDFDEAENEVIGVLGQQAARQIIKSFPNSEAVMYALGKNPEKLREIAGLLKRSPVAAVVALTKYADSIVLKPRKKAPDPNQAERASASGAGGNAQAQLDKLRDKVAAGEATMDQVLAFKKDCKAKGIKVA